MLKKCSCLLLPTNQKASIHQHPKGVLYKSIEDFIQDCKEYKSYHIYILSDDRIEENDWFIMNSCIIRQCSLHKGDVLDTIGGLHHESVCKKIIATTDKSIKVNNPDYDIGELAYIPLPQPSQSFITKFIESYNSDKPITDVMVEYEGYECINGHYMVQESHCCYPHCEEMCNIPQLKISKDNTISIKRIKDSWNRDEHIEDIKRMINLYSTTYLDGNIDKWINDNL